ncbi:MAG: SpoIIE family protein phosphatase, partial [Bacteroidota bacterium]
MLNLVFVVCSFAGMLLISYGFYKMGFKTRKNELSNLTQEIKKVIEDSAEAILIVDADTQKILNLNNNAVVLYGFECKEDLIGKMYNTITFQGKGSGDHDLTKINNKTSYHYCTQHVCKNGNVMDVKVKVQKISYNALTCFLYYITDITDELKLHEQKHQLEIEKEYEIAAQIQNSFLPSNIPGNDQIEIAIYSKPAKKVGGDYFGFHWEEKKLALLITDVMGKGLSAAIMVATIHSAFNILTKFSCNPSKIMRDLNNNLFKDLKDSPMFVSAFYG